MERSLSEIMRSANADGDAAAAFGAGETLRSLLLARLYVTKFLSGHGQGDVDRVRSELADASKAAGQLMTQLQTAQRRKLVREVEQSLAPYTGWFKTRQATILQPNT